MLISRGRRFFGKAYASSLDARRLSAPFEGRALPFIASRPTATGSKAIASSDRGISGRSVIEMPSRGI